MNPPPAGRRSPAQPVVAPPPPGPPDPPRPSGRIRRLATRIGAAVRSAHSAAVPF